jgi:hypothetical protein
MDASACRGADWYELGFRDAIFGMQRQDHLYASQCAGHGVALDTQRYSQGWHEGVWEFNSRTPHGVD